MEFHDYAIKTLINSDICRGYKDYLLGELRKAENIKALGEELRKVREGITDEKMLIGYNMAIAICNKYLGESEDKNEKGEDEQALESRLGHTVCI